MRYSVDMAVDTGTELTWTRIMFCDSWDAACLAAEGMNKIKREAMIVTENEPAINFVAFQVYPESE